MQIPEVLHLYTAGLAAHEQQLVQGVVNLAMRRKPAFVLLPPNQAQHADVYILNGLDPSTLAWATQNVWLSEKYVFWIDRAANNPKHVFLKRPVAWPALPLLITRQYAKWLEKEELLENQPIVTEMHNKEVLVISPQKESSPAFIELLHAYELVVQEGSTDDAFKKIQRKIYGAIFVDARLPAIDGHEYAMWIKQKALGQPYTVLLADRAQALRPERLAASHADGFLAVPPDTTEMHHLLMSIAKYQETNIT